MTDKTVQDLLEEILEELREIRRAGEQRSTGPAAPDQPLYNPVPPPMRTPCRPCKRCGLNLDGVMGYVCTDPQCPTGFGPTTC